MNKRQKDFYYRKIIKEEKLKEKWRQNIPVTEQEIEEMIYIDKHVEFSNIYER
jgi:hypothetical protein